MQPILYFFDSHKIDLSLLDPDVLYVLNKLHTAGHTAYLVGGSVRDLLLGRIPKDFDISTSALPEQIKTLFQKRCLLIGRRFRLAHIRFGHKILEVSTFRSGENEADLITHDNQWGTPQEDVLRRDFTINGLFYDLQKNAIIDYIGGWKDLRSNTLRTIGDPLIRFKQDPVRMIRLLKFKSRFAFHVDQATNKALLNCYREITKSAPARILEEIFRMLESGFSSHFFQLMGETGLLELLFPCLTHFMTGPHGHHVYSLLKAADEYHKKHKHPLNRSVLTTCLLFPILDRELHTQFIDQGKIPHISDIVLLTGSLIKGFVTSSFSHFPKRISGEAGFILSTQYRLTPLNKHPVRLRVLHLKEFQLALDLLNLRTACNPALEEVNQTWQEHRHSHQRIHSSESHLKHTHERHSNHS